MLDAERDGGIRTGVKEGALAHARGGTRVANPCYTLNGMRVTRRVAQEVEVTTDILCNRCGQSCEPVSKNGEAHGLVEATVHGGYGSKELHDGARYTFSLCERCLVVLFATFKIPVQTDDAG